MAATETPQTPTPSWIHPSAASFYASDALRKTAQRVKTRRGVLNVALDRAWRGRGRGRGRGHLLWLEFGVWKGDDIAHIASWLREKHRRSGGGGRRGDGDGDGVAAHDVAQKRRLTRPLERRERVMPIF